MKSHFLFIETVLAGYVSLVRAPTPEKREKRGVFNETTVMLLERLVAFWTAKSRFLYWWVVQDNSLRSPFGPSPQAAPLSHYVRPEPAQVRIFLAYRQQKGAFRAPFYIGGSCRIRTCDQLIKSQLLYQLS